MLWYLGGFVIVFVFLRLRVTFQPEYYIPDEIAVDFWLSVFWPMTVFLIAFEYVCRLCDF